MNYENTKEMLRKDMEGRNYAVDTQNKFTLTLESLCKYSGKIDNVALLDHSDVRSFLTCLNSERSLGASTVNNYHTAIKFIFEVTLKKSWNDSIFPYLKDNKEPTKTALYNGIYSNNLVSENISIDEALHKMIMEMELRGFATGTQSAYLRPIRKLVKFTNKQNNLILLNLDDVRNFLHNLHMILKLNPQTINIHRTAVKFLFIHVLNKDWDENRVPHLKNHKYVPVVLSKEEVANLINSIENDTYKTIALLMYSSGLRVGEAIKLRISDIDSKNMQLLISDGKRNKDRYAILSEKCLHALRDYYRKYKPTNYLFEGQRYNLYISKESVQGAIRVAAIKCGINKTVTPHTLRHCFGTHLLENNTNLYYIKQLLGHSCVRTTSRYLETISFANMNVKSPLDTLSGIL